MVQDLGGYRLIEELGSGGMGVVYLGVDGGNNPVAVKVLHPHIAGDETARKRLAREVRTLRRIRHPRIAEVLDAELDADQPFIITEFVDGQTLSDDVRENGPFAEDELVHFGHALLDALNAVHESGVIHRDLKPANVMIMDGEPMVIDFGIAQVADEVKVTATGLVMGTPGYLSPEIADGKPSSEKTDWWGWAATMAFAATGRNPYGSGPLEAVLGRVAMGKYDLGRTPTNFVPLLKACLEPRPERRPSGQMILDALVDIESGRMPQLGSSPSGASGGSAGAGGSDPVWTSNGTAVMPAVGDGAGGPGSAVPAPGAGAGAPSAGGPGNAVPGAVVGGVAGLGATGHGAPRGGQPNGPAWGSNGNSQVRSTAGGQIQLPGGQGYQGQNHQGQGYQGQGSQGQGSQGQQPNQFAPGQNAPGQNFPARGHTQSRPGDWPGQGPIPGTTAYGSQQNGGQYSGHQGGSQPHGQGQLATNGTGQPVLGGPPGSQYPQSPGQTYGPGGEGGPGAFSPVKTGGWVVFALVVLAVVIMPLSPLIIVAFALVWSVFARTATRLDRKLQRYRFERGSERGGTLRSVASAPVSILASIATSAASFILPAIAGVALLVLTRLDVAGIVPGSMSEQWSVWAAAAAGALVLWVGPGAASLRHGSRLLVSGATRNQLGRLIALSAIVLMILLGIMVVQSGAEMNWWPLTESPFSYLPGPV